MRLAIVIAALCGLVAIGSFSVSTASAQTLAPSAQPVPSEGDIVKWSFTQGALTLVLVLTLVSYRRDFFRRVEGRQDEVDRLRQLLERNAEAMLRQAVAISENTQATVLLAQNVNNLAERRGPR